jgi:hypothetical protein
MEHARPDRGTAAPAAEATSAAAPGGPAKAHEAQRMTDPEAIVKTASTAFNGYLGQVLDRQLAGYIAALAWLDFPTLTYGQIVELIYPAIVRDKEITRELILDRARAIATIVVHQ